MSTNNPWKTISINEVYDNNWINITHRKVINPSGQNGIYGKVHFKNIAVGVLPLDHENNTWLVGQYRYTLGEYSWEIPEGGCINSIEPLQAAKNELKEETGITAKKWTKLLEIHTSNSVTDEFGVCYIAQELSFGKSSPEPCEELMVKKVPFEKAFEMVMNGEITDSLSFATIMKTKLLLFS
ncbi:NUDIX hydrolase [Saprospiraceae bacterium]|jgi:ADP-ribose pyrophosphatase|nr:NUDIX hydrolase [Saprospiraceae bacterium]MDG1433080.1 NUDIX hydrolase [Saprospiraceae bacterium]